MATIRAFTTIEQSHKLAEILPLESADMHYRYDNDFHELESIPTITEENDHFILFPEDVRCWSIAALLEIIKKLVGYSLQSLDTHTVFMNCELGDKPYNIETENYDNPVDACYELILKLHELNLL